MVVRVSDLGKRLKMMMWHTVVGANVCTRIMATCHAVIRSESNFFFKFAMHIRPRFSPEPRQ